MLKQRCAWAGSNPLMVRYHDTEWGVPVHDDRVLFEFLILEAAQAGLSWRIVLNKRESYRAAFAGFDPQRVARYDKRKIAALMRDPGIVRNRLKIESAVTNASAFIAVQQQFGSFDAYIWQFVGGKALLNFRRSARGVPASTALSDKISKELKQIGFRFVGTTICYAYMQAIGMVNDHLRACFRHKTAATRP
ncbi:MAG: DNA-3-methyladenine glycosylase I [Burkholderiales bacterium]